MSVYARPALGQQQSISGPDFGLSINEGQSVAKSMEVGTPGYCAPELLMRTNLTTSYDGKKADGALLHSFAHGWLSCVLHKQPNSACLDT